ncbi:MAG TPA: hypothetical protein VGC85_03240 [Chthoniobacterales bacterium]
MHTAVHAIAEPMVAVAVAPLRIAYQTERPADEVIYHAPLVDEDEELSEFAYNTGRIRRQHPPHAERAEPVEASDEEANAPRKFGAEEAELIGGSKPVVGGSHAVLRNGIAHAPSNAPASVKNAIWAANTLRRKPYVWGGGHGSFNDNGYDCSGTVSFALHHAGVLAAPLPSSDLARFGERGRGRWITIYTRPGHTFAVIAGLRLDTTDFYNGGNVGPRWHEDMRETFGYVARHPVGL